MNRKTLAALAFLVLAAGCFGGKKVTPFDMDSRRLGVVMNYGYLASNKEYLPMETGFPDELSRTLFDTQRLRVIDRARLMTSLGDASLPVDQPLNSEQMENVAKALKAEVTVYGDILSVQKDVENHKHRITERLLVTVDSKLVLSNTAEILSRGQATGSAVIRYKEGNPPPAEVLINAALKDAATKTAYLLVADLQPK